MKQVNLFLMLAVMLMASAFAGAAQDDELIVWADEAHAPVVEEIAAQFTADFDIPVVVHEIGFGDIRDQFKTAAPAGEGPDVLMGPHDWLGEMAVNGLLAEIDISDIADQFLPSAVAAFVYEGVQYGMPTSAENVGFLRNTDLVPDNPATWDDVRAISEALQASGDAQYGFIMFDNNPYHFFPLQTAFGGYVFGLTAAGYDPNDVGIDNEGSIAAAAYLEAYGADGLMPTGIDYEVLHSMFESGDAAMIITGPWAMPRILESGVNFEVASIPAGPSGAGKPFLGVWGFMISAFSENKLAAETFVLDYVGTPEGIESLYSASPRPAAMIAVREAMDDELTVGFANAGIEGLAMPAIPEMSSVWSAWGNAMELVRTGELDAETAFSNAGEQIRSLLAEQ
ncbi:MAG: maltose ABC transporter substrate-binding protein [Chloroflexi bacterium]|nr:maltose ABC transporter substrate-binding protein [Chloroflexota bacterium]MCY4246999.1 maltose ABC transporter substrate-binding protein [Chloroflexota bacterium]